MNNEYSWVPLVLSISGALISFMAALCVAIIAWLVKYVLGNSERRILQLEVKAEGHDKYIASATTQTVSEQQAIARIDEALESIRTKFDTFIADVAELMAQSKVANAKPARKR